MIFNKKDSVQKNWRMVKKGKNIVFGCMLFFTAGAVVVNPLSTVFNGNGIVHAQTGVAPVIENNLAGKASTAAVVTVKAQAGSTVKLYDSNDVLIGEAVANTQGIATINPTNSLPEGTITATSTPVGGEESPKSAPVTITRATLDEAGGKVVNGLYGTQLSLGKTKLTVYPGDSINVPIEARANFLESFWVPKNPLIISGVKPVGAFLATAKSTPVYSRSAAFQGTVAMNQPAGDFTITFAAKGKLKSDEVGKDNPTVTKTLDLNVIVLELAKKYTPVLNKKVTVDNPNNVTEVEKDKIIAIVKQENPTLPEGTTYSVDNNGNVTVTYPDSSQDKISAAYSIQKRPVITTDLTEKALTKTPIEVTAEPGSTVILYDKNNNKIGQGITDATGRVTIIPDVNIPEGNVTVKATDKRGNISDSSNPVVATKVPDAKGIKDPAKTPVKNPAALTNEEKEKVKDAVKAANPTATNVEVGADGTTTVTFPDGSTATLTPDKTVKEADANGIKDPAVKTPVKDPSALTEDEKGKVKDAVKAANPTATNVEVGADGTTTVTFPDGSTATLTPDKTVKAATGANDPAVKTPVKNPAALTEDEKAKVADEVKKANPTATKVEVGADGTATVTFPDGSTATLTPDKTVKEADANGIKDPAVKTPVKNPAALTEDEKAKVADEVKKANPTATKVEVGADGTTTVTFPDGSTATLTPDKTVKAASVAPETPGTINIPGNKVPVGNKENLTPEEIAKVKEEVEKVNPGKTVVVDAKGNATVTDPNTNLVLVIPAEELVKLKEQPQPAPTPSPIIPSDKFEVKVPTVKVPVADAKNLTPEEVTKVKEEVEKVNPGKTVVVDAKGNATVTDPNDPTAKPAIIPGDNLVVEKEKPEEAKPATPIVVNVPGNKVPVGNKENLTPEEIAKVKEEVEKVNPGKTVVVDAKGNAKLTDQNTGKVVVIPGKALVEQKATPLPTPPKQSESIKTPSLTIVENPRNLTLDEKEKVKKAVKAANPTATKVEVGADGTATVTFPDGSVAILTPAQTILPKEVKPSDNNKNRDGVDDTNYKATDNKGRLSSTGLNSTESSVLGLIGLFAGIALATRRRKKEK